MKLTRVEFEKLALEQLDLLYRVARRLTGGVEAARDLVQETFVRALRASDSFDLHEAGIRPWLVRIMQNLHFSRSAREKRQPLAMGDQLPDAAGPAVVSSAGGVASVDWEAMDQRLAAALRELPPEYQTVLLLWAVEEFSYKEIAQAVEIPIGTVMSRLHRARQRLAEVLRDLAVETRVIRE